MLLHMRSMSFCLKIKILKSRHKAWFYIKNTIMDTAKR